jgi:hypothetical protein
MAKSTLEDLIAFMYNESSSEERSQVEQELKEDWTLREKYNVLKESFERLNKMKLHAPRQQSIDAILKYACCTENVSFQ